MRRFGLARPVGSVARGAGCYGATGAGSAGPRRSGAGRIGPQRLKPCLPPNPGFRSPFRPNDVHRKGFRNEGPIIPFLRLVRVWRRAGSGGAKVSGVVTSCVACACGSDVPHFPSPPPPPCIAFGFFVCAVRYGPAEAFVGEGIPEREHFVGLFKPEGRMFGNNV